MNYPIGVQDFETLRKGGFVYVDKSALIYKLTRGHIYFLGRPRRFGKSLLVSTLKYYFQGRKDLFEGLKIAELENEWQQYPVLHFDFNRVSQPKALQEYIREQLDEWEQEYPFNARFESLALRFDWLLRAAHKKTGKQVVVLIDEYDKPLLDLLETGNPDDEKQLQQNRDFLKDFFSVFKAADEHLRFVLLTGITKFSQVSMFSGFNQPDDISIDTRFDSICGITEQELFTVFADSIAELADSLN
nr:AAA family ATPase [Prevotella sp.]